MSLINLKLDDAILKVRDKIPTIEKIELTVHSSDSRNINPNAHWLHQGRLIQTAELNIGLYGSPYEIRSALRKILNKLGE